MKYRLFFLLFLSTSLLYGNTLPNLPEKIGESNPLEGLDDIITLTRESYQNQLAIREHIVEYLQLQKKYLDNPNDQKQLYYLIRKADQVMEEIQNNELGHAFDSEFMKELALFSRIAKKNPTPRP